jgi:ribosomal protein L11 methyltransferase
MREVSLRVPRIAVEEILDRLLPIVPGGVRETPSGRHVELRMRGPELPDETAIKRAAGRWPCEITEREVADDWRARRLEDYRPEPIAGKLVVRPPWAPAAPAGMFDIVLSESAAFGAGTHPTTRTCLELLLALGPAGSFADLGCGTGVIAILAAKLGWAPVAAVDVQAGSVESTAHNAAANGVAVDAQLLDLSADGPPPANGIAANIPAWLHARLALSLPEPLPSLALLSGFGPGDAGTVAAAYAARGLGQRERVDASGWCVLHLGRD